MQRKRKIELANDYLFVLLAVTIAVFMIFYEHAAMTAYPKTLEQGEKAGFAIGMILVYIFIYILLGVFLAALAVSTLVLTASLQKDISRDEENPLAGRKRKIAIAVLKCIATAVIGEMVRIAFKAEWATVFSKIVYCVAAACSLASVGYNFYRIHATTAEKRNNLEKGEEQNG